MNNTSRLSILIGIQSPILSSGVANVLRHIPDIHITPTEVCTYEELIEKCKHSDASAAIVSPSFGGHFNPEKFRQDTPDDIKLIALEVGPLAPSARNLYDSVISVIDDIPSISLKLRGIFETDDKNSKSKEQLSSREKEIIINVVKGLTNKEIADKLFISVHTVITHRRNIARKLEIHSATGLTIYAIVNHLVDISDIRI